MKKLKFIYLSILLVVFSLVSCENNEPIVDDGNPNQSASVKTAMQELQRHFNDDGSLNGTNNPVGNIVFDYCFDFQLPITLSYNTGATVVINDFGDMVSVLISMTDVLYIDGIVFPFNVETYDENTGAIVVRAINNEQEFAALIDSCDFDIEDCICTEEYAPVCVEIQEPSGESFTVEFPNVCFAACEGFTQNDFVDCNDDYEEPGDDDNDDCFHLNFPITLVDGNGVTTVAESEEELENILYSSNENLDFVYPFNVTLESDGSVLTIEDATAYARLIASCDSNHNECNIENLTVVVGDCNADGTYSITIDFDYANAGNASFDLYVRNQVLLESYSLSDLPVTFSHFATSTFSEDYIRVAINDNNDCYEELEWMSPNCNTTACWEFVYPITFTNGTDSVDVNDRAEFDAQFNPSTSRLVYPFSVVIEGETSVINTPNNFFEIGEFENMCN